MSSGDDYQTEHFITSLLQRYLFVEGLQLYNRLPVNVNTASNVKQFIIKLRKFWFKC